MGGGGDWNIALLNIDKKNPSNPPQPDQINTFNQLLSALGGPRLLSDGWREKNQDFRAYTFFTAKGPVSRIDRLYVREDWMKDTEGWGIEASGLPTDHKALTMTIKFSEVSDRGPGRWRLNPLLLSRKTIREACSSAINDLTGCDPLEEWRIYKETIALKLIDITKQSEREAGKLSYNLRQRRLVLQKQRGRRVQKVAMLEEMIASVEQREEHLAEAKNHDYAYNAMAKHLILNEKPTRWFFARAKEQTSNTITALKDEQGITHTDSQGMLQLATKFYTDLYSTKPSEKTARDKILSSMTRHVEGKAYTAY